MNNPADFSNPDAPVLPSWQALDEIRFLPGRDSLVEIVQAVCTAVGPLVLSEDRLNRLQAAAEKALQDRPAEAAGSPGAPAEVRVRVLAPAAISTPRPEDGTQAEPLPWGFFVMTRSEPRCYRIDLFLYLEG